MNFDHKCNVRMKLINKKIEESADIMQGATLEGKDSISQYRYETELAMDTELEDIVEVPIGERDTMVLNTIREESLTGFTFDGLKRRLGMHPEALSRVLKRLKEKGMVEKAQGGYRVTQKTMKLFKLNQLNEKGQGTLMLQTRLPYDLPIQQVISNLIGRWFGMLRWLGYSQNEEGITLKWINEDGKIQINAIFSAKELNIEAKLKEGKDLSNAIKASHQLIGFVAKLSSRMAQKKRIAYINLFEPYKIPACM